MSNCTVAAPVRATEKKNSAPKAVKRPAPLPITPLPEGDKLALEGADILQNIVITAIYGESDEPRNLHNTHMEEADRLLWRLLSPERHKWEEGDPTEGHIGDHLARISSELEGAIEVMTRYITGFSVDEFVIPWALTTYAYHYADELFAAYNGLPGTLEALRALTTQAGAHAAIERHLASDLAARLRADVPGQQSATADAPNADEKLVAETVVSQLRAAYDEHYRGLSVDASCLLTAAINELESVLDDRKSEGAIHLAASMINGCIHIEQAADVDSLIAEILKAQYATLESASIGYGFAQDGCEALATGIRAGIKRHRDPPQPPIRRVDAKSGGLTQAQYKTVLQMIAARCDTLNHLLMQAQSADEGFDSDLAVDAAQAIAEQVGAMADVASGCNVVGDADRWNYGPNFKTAGQESEQ
ncbi:MAG: hypothetical protein WBC18_14625 [Ottowia sp.]|uniref:hypothetical protein n=1 Tax=Ottowia sp. TaxID=1898956 RepID=UPI003C77BB51